MSCRLRDLIKAVRSCKTAAEERSVIAKESAALRKAFREQDTLFRHRNVAKLMFIHMLGYPTHFGQMEALKLIAANTFPEKRIGYLGLMILLDERHEVLMLVTNSLKNDLVSRNQFSVGLALTALGNICSIEMARDLSPELLKLLGSSNNYIRKKAALCCTRVIKKVPELIENFQEAAVGLINDKNHSVMLAGVTLMLNLCNEEPSLIPFYKAHIPTLVKILRSLLVNNYVAEYDFGGGSNPFLQVKILQLLQMFGKNSEEHEEQISDVLAQIATNVEGNRNADNAILYETVQTMLCIENTSGLQILAVNILGRFLSNKDNNIRYVALNTLAKVVRVNAHAVQRHRQIIVDCVKDNDMSIRRRALDLVYALVNSTNIHTLTKELIEYLKVSDTDFKPSLSAKICQLVQLFASSKRWYFDSILQMEHEVLPRLHAGEFGDQLVASNNYLEGESALRVSGQEVVTLVEDLLLLNKSNSDTVEYALTALAKLSVRLPNEVDKIKVICSKYNNHINLEIQSRSNEYKHILNHGELKNQLMESMPVLDEKSYSARFSAPALVATGMSLNMDVNTNIGNLASEVGDLLSLDDDTSSVQAPDNSKYLMDLLENDVQPSIKLQNNSAASRSVDLLFGDAVDLLGNETLPDVVSQLPDQLQSTTKKIWPTLNVYEKNGIRIEFNFDKDETNNCLTNIKASYLNDSLQDVSKFSVQVAVPKYLQLKLDPATGSSLLSGSQPITQQIHISNSQQDIKPLILKLRILYTINGVQNVEQIDLRDLPHGL